MDEQLPHNFSAAIQINGQEVEFNFMTMNIKTLQLFQVYFTWQEEKTKRRFHMQKNKQGNFLITDKFRLPADADIPEQELADLIIKHHT